MAGTSNDLNIAIQIRAQIAQAEASLKSVQAQIAQLGTTAEAASGASTGAAAQMEGSMAAAAASMQAMSAAVAESQAAATSRIHAMVQTSLEARGAQDALAVSQTEASAATAASAEVQGVATAATGENMDATDALAASYLANQAAVRQQMADLGVLDDIMEGTARSTDDLALQEAALDRLMQGGVITASEQTAALEALSVTEKKYALGEAEAAASTTEHAAAETGLTATLASGGATREYTALLDEGLRHNYSRMGGTVSVLAGRLGIMQKILSPVGLAIIGVTAAVAGFVALAVMAIDRTQKLEDANLATGGAIGLTTSAMGAQATAIGQQIGTIGRATDAMAALANTGHFSADTLAQATAATVELAQVTGSNLGNAEKLIESLTQNTSEAVVKLNNQFHFLTEAQYETIQGLQQTGDSAGAAKEAIADLENTMRQRAERSEEDSNIFVKGWHAVANAFDELGTRFNVVFGGGTIAEKMALIREHINALGIEGVLASGKIEKLNEQLNALAAQENSEEHTAQLSAKLQKTEQAAIQAAQSIDKLKASLKTPDEAKEKIDELTQSLIALYRANSQAKELEGMTFTVTGTGDVSVSGAAYDKLKAAIEKKFAEKPPALPALSEIRSFKSDDSGLQSQLQSFDRLDEAANQHAARQAEIADVVNRGKVIAGQMSASEQLEQQRELANALYAQQLGSYRNELQMIGRKPADIQAINAKIVALEDQHQLKMQQLNNQMLTDAQQKWQSILSPISQAFEESIRGVIRGTTTVRNAMRNMAQSILLEFINMGIKMVTQWAANQLALTGATAAGESTRLAIKQAADKQSLLSTALTTTKEILMKVWSVMANVYNSVASIPFIGWILAPAMAIGAGALVASWAGRVASAAGGWVVPHDQLAMVHEHETILPRRLSEGFQDIINGNGRAGSGGDVHLHVHTMDTAGVRDFFKQNQFELANALRAAHRNGAFA